jgi:O-antigen/teichoic acid export membrane protein
MRGGVLSALGRVAGTSALARAMGVVKGLIVARLLMPKEYGVSTLVSVVIGYAQYADLGATMAAYRDFTSSLGRSEHANAERYARWMSSLKLLSLLAVAVACLLASLRPTLDAGLAFGFRLLPAMCLPSGILFVVLLIMQAHGQIHELNRLTTLSSALDLSLGIALTYVFGLRGLLVAGALAPALAAAWTVRGGNFVRPLRVPLPVLRTYVATGVPLVAIGLIDHNLVYIDHLIVLTFFSLSHLGIYNIALIAADLLRMFGLAMGIVLGPSVVKELARSDGQVAAVRRLTLLPVQLLASLLPFAIAALWYGGDYGIRRFYPRYADAIWPMHILVVAFYFLVVDTGVTYFLFAIDKHRRNLLIAGPALAFNVVVDIILIKYKFGIAAVALGSLMTFLAYAAVHLWYVAKHFLSSIRDWTVFVAGILAPILYLLGLLSAAHVLLPLPPTLIQALATGALTWVLLSPLLWRAVRIGRDLDAAMRSPSA